MSNAPVIDESLTRWSHPAGERAGKPLLVLLHGYGADEHDLFGLRELLPAEYVVAAVAAPLTPPWPAPGRSWYAIEQVTSGAVRNSESITLAGQSLLTWLDASAGDATSITLLGFSQGAAVSLQALRLAPDRFAAIVALSGYAATGELPGDAVLRESRPPVFWGRGGADEVIPGHLLDHTAQWLPDHATLSGRVYPGLAHAISEEELADIRAFLAKNS